MFVLRGFSTSFYRCEELCTHLQTSSIVGDDMSSELSTQPPLPPSFPVRLTEFLFPSSQRGSATEDTETRETYFIFDDVKGRQARPSVAACIYLVV